MTQFDRRLSDALSAEDEAFLNGLDVERGLFAQIGETFRGPLRYMTLAANVGAMAATAVGLWAVWEMFAAPDTRSLILWTAAGWAAWTVQLALKQWIFDRMRTLGVMRELKRIELRLAMLETGRTPAATRA